MTTGSWADPVVSISLTHNRPGYPCLEIRARLPIPPPPCLGANQQHNSVSEKHQSGAVSQISWHPWLTRLMRSVCVGLCIIVCGWVCWFVCVCVIKKKTGYLHVFLNVTSLLQLTPCVVSTYTLKTQRRCVRCDITCNELSLTHLLTRSTHDGHLVERTLLSFAFVGAGYKEREGGRPKNTWSSHHIWHLSTTAYRQGAVLKASALFEVSGKVRWCWSHLVPEMFALIRLFLSLVSWRECSPHASDGGEDNLLEGWRPEEHWCWGERREVGCWVSSTRGGKNTWSSHVIDKREHTWWLPACLLPESFGL